VSRHAEHLLGSPPLAVGPSAHCFSIPLRRSPSLTKAQSCSPHRNTYTFFTREPSHRGCASELPPHHCPTSSVRSRVHTLVRRLRRGPWTTLVDTFPRPASRRPFPSAPHCVRFAREGAAHTLRAMWAATWAVHMVRCGPRRARSCPVATGLSRPHALCLWPDYAGFGPWAVF
jgi:hypothetical protein